MENINNPAKKSPFIIGGTVFTLALIYIVFSQMIATTGEIPWFFIGIYLVGLTQAMLFYTFGNKIFAKGTLSREVSAIIAYHAWACFVFGMLLIFNTEGLLNASTGFASVVGNNNDRVGLQLTQICGAWVLAYSLLSYATIFFTKNNAKTALWLMTFAIFAQFSEVVIKFNSDGGVFGLGARINSHHVLIQLIGLVFLWLAYRKKHN